MSTDDPDFDDRPPRRRGCLPRLIALLVAVMVAFAGFQSVGLTMDDVQWFRDRVAAEVDELVNGRDAEEVLIDGVAGEPGSGGEGYTFAVVQSDGVSPVTWPCEGTIPIEVNPQGAPDGFADLLDSAVHRINEASGFSFVVKGETVDRDFLERRPGPVLLGFAEADEVDRLTGATAGVGGSLYVSRPGDPRLTSAGGMVVLDTEVFGGRMGDPTKEAIILHELAHVLGLGHTTSRGELMRAMTTYQVDFGEGDRAGLAHLREYACS